MSEREKRMYTIQANFQRFRDLNLSALIGATGVYVIWDARAKARPTYIGEGNILRRFTDHVKRDNRRFAHPWNGYVAIIGGSTHDVHKTESTVVERLILDVAKDTDRAPQVNVHPGHARRVLRFCRDETLRIAVSGYDPLMRPTEAKLLHRAKEIKVWASDNSLDNYEFGHDWRLRRLRRPII
jgi:hypothetical protein